MIPRRITQGLRTTYAVIAFLLFNKQVVQGDDQLADLGSDDE